MAFFDPFILRIASKFDDVQTFGQQAFAQGIYTMDMMPKGGGKMLSGPGKFTNFFRKESDGSWKYALVIFEPLDSPWRPPQSYRPPHPRPASGLRRGRSPSPGLMLPPRRRGRLRAGAPSPFRRSPNSGPFSQPRRRNRVRRAAARHSPARHRRALLRGRARTGRQVRRRPASQAGRCRRPSADNRHSAWEDGFPPPFPD